MDVARSCGVFIAIMREIKMDEVTSTENKWFLSLNKKQAELFGFYFSVGANFSKLEA